MSGFLTSKETAENVVEISKNKTELKTLPMLLLGILAGAYIGFGSELYTMVTYDLTKFSVGFAKFIGGSVFSVGLILVVIAGAELFTGNCLILTGVLTRKVSLKAMLRNWFIVYIANFVGSVLIVIIMFYSGLWKVGDMKVGVSALNIAVTKVNLSFLEAFFRGIGCNWLVCLAVWLAIASKDSIGKFFGIYFPIMTFVATGFEHSIANMYFIPMGLFLKGNISLVNMAGLNQTIGSLTWLSFLVNNLIPVTLGNIVGGAFFVSGFYYLIYLRKSN